MTEFRLMYIVFSIMIYIFVFLMSLLFINKAEQALKRNNSQYIIFSVFAIAVPCLLAAFRGNEVGTDTLGYNELYLETFEYNFSGFLEYTSVQGIEAGYSIFLFILSKLQFSGMAILFITELIIILPVYYIATKQRNYQPMWTCMAVYYFLFYNISYNATRQCVALSFILLSFYFFTQQNYFKGFCWGVLAIFFHHSAYIGLAFVFLAILYENINIRLFRRIFTLFIFFVLAFLPIYLPVLTDLLVDWGIITGRQSFYTVLFSDNTSARTVAYKGLRRNGYISIVLRLICFFLPSFYIMRDKLLKDKQIRALKIVTFVGTVFYVGTSLAFNTVHVYRVSLYAEYFYILYLPKLYFLSKERRYGVTMYIRNILFVLFLLTYWLLTFMRFNYHQTNNYFML